MQQEVVGDLIVPSGKIIACDPSYLSFPNDCPQFTRAVPPGKYPITICRLFTTGSHPVHQGIACAVLRLTDAAPISWEMALRPGEDMTTLESGTFFGYSVDAGTGSFVDAVTVAPLNKQERYALYFDRIVPEMMPDRQEIKEYDPESGFTCVGTVRTGDRPNRDSANVVIDPKTGANLIAFNSGMGDGGYASYWGIDDSGNPCCLATDFLLLVEFIREEITLPLNNDVAGNINHPDFSRIGVRCRITRTNRHLIVETEGKHCDIHLINYGEKIGSSVMDRQGKETRPFELSSPLSHDACLVFEYGAGRRSLRTL